MAAENVRFFMLVLPWILRAVKTPSESTPTVSSHSPTEALHRQPIPGQSGSLQMTVQRGLARRCRGEGRGLPIMKVPTRSDPEVPRRYAGIPS